MKEKELKELLDQYAEEISEWMTEEFKTRERSLKYSSLLFYQKM